MDLIEPRSNIQTKYISVPLYDPSLRSIQSLHFQKWTILFTENNIPINANRLTLLIDLSSLIGFLMVLIKLIFLLFWRSTLNGFGQFPIRCPKDTGPIITLLWVDQKRLNGLQSLHINRAIVGGLFICRISGQSLHLVGR